MGRTTDTPTRAIRSVNFTPGLLAEVDHAAAAMYRDRSQFVRDAIRHYIRHLRANGELSPVIPSTKAS